MTEPYRWSKPFGGVPGLSPDQYFHLGRVSAVMDLANGPDLTTPEPDPG